MALIEKGWYAVRKKMPGRKPGPAGRSFRRSITFGGATALVTVAGLAGLAAQVTAQAARTASASHWKAVYLAHAADWRGDLLSVTAPARDHAWAVGITKILNWNGTRWLPAKVPEVANFLPALVDASSAGNVWIFGHQGGGPGMAHVWNGTTKSWRKLETPAQGFIAAAVVSSSDVWGYGGNSQGCFTDPAAASCLYHWSGTGWTETRLSAVAPVAMAAAGKHAWFAGLTDLRNPNAWNTTGRPVIYEATNGKLRKIPGPAVTVRQDGSIAATPAGQLWLSVEQGTNQIHMLLFHWTGHRWTQIKVPTLAGGVLNVTGSVVPDGKTGVWDGPYAHWTGAKWINMETTFTPAQSGYNFDALAVIPGTASIWAVGELDNEQNATIEDSLVAVYGPLP